MNKRAYTVLCFSVTLAACGSDRSGFGAASDASTDRHDASADVSRDGASDGPNTPAAAIVGVIPDHGSFFGGTEVTLRGINFTEDAVVRFGGAMVQPRNTRFVDRGRIVVLTPANRPGLVDVEVDVGGRTARLPMGYHYDAVFLDPAQGPTSGGARVTFHGSGTHFSDRTTITFDGAPCTSPEVTGPELMSCLTPAHPDGRVDVVVTTGDDALTLTEGYQYADESDTVQGGLSGGVLHGSLTITVFNAMTGGPVPMAQVFLDDDPRAVPPRAGITNARGQVTLAPPGLMAPVTVTASAHCFSTTTVQSFDASHATVALTPLMIPGCGEGMPEPMTARPVYPATLSGELVWEGPNEFAPNRWANVPEPRTGERRVAFVYASRADIFEQDPTTNAAMFMARVLEQVREGYGGRGYPFRLIARPAALAVYALAGIENTTTMRFTPYVMGVARGVLGSPRGTTSGIVVDMTLPLDHVTALDVAELPPESASVNNFHGSVFIDLGGEGVVPMQQLAVTGHGGGMYRFAGLPPFRGTLTDARLTVHARMASGMITGPRTFADTPAPCTGLLVRGITTPDATVPVRDWLGIPDLMTPRSGDSLPRDRTVRFTVPGMAPDVMLLNLNWGSGQWQHFAPGADRAIRYPDLSTLMGVGDLPPSTFMSLSLVGVRIPGFQFDRFTYTSLAQTYWTAYAGRGAIIQR